jgi:hypothetical protein
MKTEGSCGIIILQLPSFYGILRKDWCFGRKEHEGEEYGADY